MNLGKSLELARVPRVSADVGPETVYGTIASHTPSYDPPESAIDNDRELREDLAVAGKNLADAEAVHASAVAANARGVSMLEDAKAAVAVARVEADRAGGNLAERIATWATDGGEDPRLGLTDDEAEAHARLSAAVATEKATAQACEALTVSLAARAKQLDQAKVEKQRAVYRVVARDMEVRARRIEALRAEADRLAHGVALFGMAFGPQAHDGTLGHQATARVASAYHAHVSGAGALMMGEPAAVRRTVEVYASALADDPNAPLPVELQGEAPVS